MHGVAWDKDGVIADTWVPYVRYVDGLFALLGKPRPYASHDELRLQIRGDHREQYRAWGIDYDDSEKAVVDAFYARAMHGVVCKPHRGVPELARELAQRGVQQAMVSNALGHHVARDLRVLGLEGILAPVFTVAELGECLKPHPFGLILAAEALGTRTVYFVGDTVDDIGAVTAARTFGASAIRSVAVSWGWGHPSLLQEAKPDYYVESVDELRKILLPRSR